MKIREQFNKVLFNLTVRSIRGTPPLRPGPHELTVLSMVHHRDVDAYLLALKSFARYVQPTRVVMVADPTITGADRELIRSHVPHIVFRDAASFHHDGIPRGGCWERLTAIAEYCADSYVIQLDADTVAVAPLADVAAAVRDGVSFTLATDDGQVIGSTHAVAQWARARGNDPDEHVQVLAEACLDRLDPGGERRYVRGCAGFAGFAPGTMNVAAVAEFSRAMGQLLGTRWSAWGTEQFASNYFVANSPGARLLPHPMYCSPHRRVPSTVFFHFVGYVRYTNGLYSRVTARVVRELKRAAAAAPARHAA